MNGIEIAATMVAVMALVITGMAAWKLHHLEDCRSRRPLVMPVFSGVAYAVLRMSWVMADGGADGTNMADVGWIVVDVSMLASIAWLMSGYCEQRRLDDDCRRGCR